jgi:ectoine hydroxylase-related dioxygenase (phytanoyl-CoA dioxygenase family)
MEPVGVYGVREFNKLASDKDRIIEEIRILGYSVVPNVLAEEELRIIRDKLDQIHEIQLTELAGGEALAEINEKDLIRLVLAYDDYFVGMATNPVVLDIVGGLLGDYYVISQQNGIMNRPDRQNYQASWHRDLSHQHFVTSRPLAVSALFCIDDFSEETGGTHVLPVSHKIESFPSREFSEQNQRCVSAKAGSILIFDSMLYHRAGHNRSDRIRRGLNHFYTLPFIKQQISIPEALHGKFSEDPFLNKFLGYASDSGKSVMQWRNAKIARRRYSA